MLRLRKGVAKFGGKKPNKAAIKLPLRDGDIERDDEAYKGHYFINANSTTAPQIVDRAVKPILDRSEVYSGCYARVSLNFYAFNSNGNKGIACGLGNIQKIRDGESLGGNVLLILLIWRSLEKMSILNIIIQIIHRMKKDTNNLKKNIKNKVYVLELWDSKCTPLTQSIVKRFKNRSSLHPLN